MSWLRARGGKVHHFVVADVVLLGATRKAAVCGYIPIGPWLSQRRPSDPTCSKCEALRTQTEEPRP